MAYQNPLPDYFTDTLGASVGTASAGDITVITVDNGALIPVVSSGEEVPAWLGIRNVPTPLNEAIHILSHAYGSTSVTILRGADGRTPTTHDTSEEIWGPGVWGDVLAELGGGGTSSTDEGTTTVQEQAAALVAAATRIRTPAERLYLFDRFG
jgi:hypothetical protein